MTFNNNALEQFEMNVGIINNFQFSLIIIALGAMISLVIIMTPLLSTTGGAVGENVVSMVAQLAKNQREIPHLITLFLVVIFINYQGMWGNIYVSTTQGFLSVAISITILLSIVIKALKNKGVRGFGNIFLNDTPIMLFTFIFVIEIFSYSLRALSLGVRLMANLLAGHILLHTLMSYLKGFAASKAILATVSSIVGILAIVLLEQAVWGIQAFVLTLLTATYLNELED